MYLSTRLVNCLVLVAVVVVASFGDDTFVENASHVETEEAKEESSPIVLETPVVSPVEEVPSNDSQKEVEETKNQNDTANSTDTDPAKAAAENTVEDEKADIIPSFSEWTQQQLAEAERRKSQHHSTNADVNTTVENGSNGVPVNNVNTLRDKEANYTTDGQGSNATVAKTNGTENTTSTQQLPPSTSIPLSVTGTSSRAKNYASPDCGAKVLSANPEAQNPWAVLSPGDDEYMLNKCSHKVWFVVELCEAIQAQKIEIANFELFSSSPKDFVITVTDRFPAREWAPVGAFVAEDDRHVQNFTLEQHLFTKFVRFELQTHHGSEHYCPLSLFRVYGTSEYEVLEKENDDGLENEGIPYEIGSGPLAEEPLEEPGETPAPSPTLLGSAGKAVVNMVMQAASVLKPKNKQLQNETAHTEWCITPAHLVECPNCTMDEFNKVYSLVSCADVAVCQAYWPLLSVEFATAARHATMPIEFLTLNKSQHIPETVLINTTINVPRDDTDFILVSPEKEFEEIPKEVIDNKPLLMKEEELPETKPAEPTNGNEVGEEEQTPESKDSKIVKDKTEQPQQVQQKESVFVRLSNKIKALERNLSLSSQYLEELSRRYKRQMEDVQKAVNRTTLATSKEKSRVDGELEMLIAKVDTLQEAVLKLIDDRDAMHSKLVGQHLFLMLVELLIMGVILCVCLRQRTNTQTLSAPESQPESPSLLPLPPVTLNEGEGGPRSSASSTTSSTSSRKNRKLKKKNAGVNHLPRVPSPAETSAGVLFGLDHTRMEKAISETNQRTWHGLPPGMVTKSRQGGSEVSLVDRIQTIPSQNRRRKKKKNNKISGVNDEGVSLRRLFHKLF